MNYFYINSENKVIMTRWKEGLFIGFVRRFWVNNYFRTKREAEIALEVKKFINKIIKEVLKKDAKTATKTNKRNTTIRG